MEAKSMEHSGLATMWLISLNCKALLVIFYQLDLQVFILVAQTSQDITETLLSNYLFSSINLEYFSPSLEHTARRVLKAENLGSSHKWCKM